VIGLGLIPESYGGIRKSIREGAHEFVQCFVAGCPSCH